MTAPDLTEARDLAAMWQARAEAAEAALDAARAIIAGSPTPPTRREFDDADVWAWLHCDGHHRFHVTTEFADVACLYGGRWWPLAADGRPRARPVAP